MHDPLLQPGLLVGFWVVSLFVVATAMFGSWWND
jgi:hypothetical protein